MNNITYNDKTSQQFYWLKDEFEMYPGMLNDNLMTVDVKKMPKWKCHGEGVERERDALRMSAQITNVINSYSFFEAGDADEFSLFTYEPSVINLEQLLQPSPHSKELAVQLGPKINIWNILFDVTTGLKNLHGNEFFHRNLRPSNIRIVKQDNRYVGKLSNMMLSKRLGAGEISQSVTENTFYGNVS